jgi:hypothetical protein
MRLFGEVSSGGNPWILVSTKGVTTTVVRNRQESIEQEYDSQGTESDFPFVEVFL